MRARLDTARGRRADRATQRPARAPLLRTLLGSVALVLAAAVATPAVAMTQAAQVSAPSQVTPTTQSHVGQATAGPAVGADPAPAVTPVEVARLIIAPQSPLVTGTGSLVITATISNPDGAAPIPADTLDFEFSEGTIDTRTELTQWLSGETELFTSPVGQLATPEVAPGDEVELTFTIDAGQLGWAGSDWGAHAIRGTLGSGALQGRTVAIWNEAPAIEPTGLLLVGQLDSPVSASGLLDADVLARLTSPTGTLTGQLAALTAPQTGAGVTIQVDPLVIASIRALGDDAPESAVAWLGVLEAHAAQVTMLPYAQHDASAVAAAGLEPLTPLGVPADDDLLTTEAATTLPGIGPALHVLTTTTPSATDLALAGTPIVAASSVDESAGWYTRDATIDVGGQVMLAADDELLAWIANATTARDPAQRAEAMAAAIALLSVVTRERPSDGRLMVSELPADADPAAVTALFELLATTPWVQGVSAVDAIAGDARGAELVADTVTDGETEAIARVNRLIEAEARVANFSTAFAQPELLRAETRLQLLAALSTTWASSESTVVGRAFLEDASAVSTSIAIVPGSNVTSVSDSMNIPIAVHNEFTQDATLELVVRSESLQFIIDQARTEIVIPAGQTVTVTVPVRSLINGDVSFVAHLEGQPGVIVGDPVRINVHVEAGVGLTVQWAFGIGVVLLFAFGIWRTIRRRSRGDAHGDLDTAIEDEKLFAQEDDDADRGGDDASDDERDDAAAEDAGTTGVDPDPPPGDTNDADPDSPGPRRPSPGE